MAGETSAPPIALAISRRDAPCVLRLPATTTNARSKHRGRDDLRLLIAEPSALADDASQANAALSNRGVRMHAQTRICCLYSRVKWFCVLTGLM
jgi:hypothetical protein